MLLVNTILLLVGIIVLIIGILAFFFPGLTRIINAPGGPKMKAIIAAIIGIILILIGLLVEIPIE
jgi:hypothetical protein